MSLIKMFKLCWNYVAIHSTPIIQIEKYQTVYSIHSFETLCWCFRALPHRKSFRGSFRTFRPPMENAKNHALMSKDRAPKITDKKTEFKQDLCCWKKRMPVLTLFCAHPTQLHRWKQHMEKNKSQIQKCILCNHCTVFTDKQTCSFKDASRLQLHGCNDILNPFYIYIEIDGSSVCLFGKYSDTSNMGLDMHIITVCGVSSKASFSCSQPIAKVVPHSTCIEFEPKVRAQNIKIEFHIVWFFKQQNPSIKTKTLRNETHTFFWASIRAQL